MTAEDVVYIGKLPPREVVLAQLLGMLAAPIRSFLYILDEKSKMGGAQSATAEPAAKVAAAPVVAFSTDIESPEQKVELTQAQ
jgi:hypothetical protein